jgi:hypothetical protein
MSSDADWFKSSLSSTEAQESVPTFDQSSTDSTEQNASESETNSETPTIVPAGPIFGGVK